MEWSGFGMGLIGGAIAIIPLLKNRFSESEEELPMGPVAIGFSIMSIGILFQAVGMLQPNCYSPADFAVRAAGEYNQKHGLW